ncbi:hypothetical protein LINPERPRIM_LOCUS17488 [Linum perenne]
MTNSSSTTSNQVSLSSKLESMVKPLLNSCNHPSWNSSINCFLSSLYVSSHVMVRKSLFSSTHLTAGGSQLG